ncbi:AAA family ATPase [Pseudosulfitobacter pseudonitzschiae]|uniref:AAA family ATPase n=1 Tax=Pseudosulfitobacter pseudonitzschiae TaxID=1402135 RepID=UPI001AF9E895|nr:AAA family ATPase [Pseudosulfitobacter pseudonitzschiae]MBM1816464.1 AAA family ATPase [Pseudosulfitobacter pseudonitzschiae]MBM1833062.1 AAA family ATPase [Pseudosulfitobacter pseudonitzschiae]MBM1837930.1 AAA family ATPase [Pseudosulfitobacter pseudonitzschiae]MBM1843191.1 AAA family ATPase [Pseudosulfitobacter pseudonitzschiae]MBM1848057.1 AAA family ATPase [Pseudosulfitobacter pseudonitzschiae]
MSDHFFVVTGGPGAGKTSLITELARRGFHTIPESGRAIIREEMAHGGDALPWADRLAYAERMLERDLRGYSDAQALSGPVIFDRGIPDILGYLTLCGLPVPPHVAAAAKAASYNARVFLAPYWDEIFTQDTERKQSHAEAEATCAVMRETYTALGYKITELPRADFVTRADFVCKQMAT